MSETGKHVYETFFQFCMDANTFWLHTEYSQQTLQRNFNYNFYNKFVNEIILNDKKKQ